MAGRGIDPVPADAVAGGVLTWRHWSDPTAFDAGTGRAFGIVVGVEVAAWVALVVGAHLVPLAWLLRYPLIGVVGALVILVAVVAVPLARSRSLAVSAVTGLGCGCVLLAPALWSLASAALM